MYYPNILEQPPPPMHRVFVSFHHEYDQAFGNYFQELFSDDSSMVTTSSTLDSGFSPGLNADIMYRRIRSEYLRDSSVTIVLIGEDTWKRKHVDWEIGASLKDALYTPRSGLIGIILPTYPWSWKEARHYTSHTIPPRLDANVECGFAKIYTWNDDPTIVQEWIHDAFERRQKIKPDNSTVSFTYNLTGYEWS